MKLFNRLTTLKVITVVGVVIVGGSAGIAIMHNDKPNTLSEVILSGQSVSPAVYGQTTASTAAVTTNSTIKKGGNQSLKHVTLTYKPFELVPNDPQSQGRKNPIKNIPAPESKPAPMSTPKPVPITTPVPTTTSKPAPITTPVPTTTPSQPVNDIVPEPPSATSNYIFDQGYTTGLYTVETANITYNGSVKNILRDNLLAYSRRLISASQLRENLLGKRTDNVYKIIDVIPVQVSVNGGAVKYGVDYQKLYIDFKDAGGYPSFNSPIGIHYDNYVITQYYNNPNVLYLNRLVVVFGHR